MESEKLKDQFKEIVGNPASIPISLENASRSAGIIVEVEERFVKGEDLPSDLFRVVISASQLLQWCGQEEKAVRDGKKYFAGNPQEKRGVLKKLKAGGNDLEEIKKLMQKLYVADPLLGARKAMELLTKLHSKYPDIPLKQNLNESSSNPQE
jgi:hypothetical protein